jgi:hypothetical protein
VILVLEGEIEEHLMRLTGVAAAWARGASAMVAMNARREKENCMVVVGWRGKSCCVLL